MIPLLMQWQSHNGAAHRKKIGTAAPVRATVRSVMARERDWA
jgi:hypothetical protein